jgi:hypothetical protein
MQVLYRLFLFRKYKKRFNSEILCAALWGVNLLIGTENGLMLLDRSGQGKLVTYLGYLVLNPPWARSENVGGVVLAPPLLYYSILTAISEDTG